MVPGGRVGGCLQLLVLLLLLLSFLYYNDITIIFLFNIIITITIRVIAGQPTCMHPLTF